MPETKSDKITCQICGEEVHSVQIHLNKLHTDWDLEKYKTKFPHAPIYSVTAQALIEKKKEEQKREMEASGKGALETVFGLEGIAGAKSARGGPIPITICEPSKSYADLVPEIDNNYVYEIGILKDVLMGYELNIPTFVFGHMGTGKSTLHEQICARTNRPFLRIQHTANTEEAHILGQKIIKDGEVVFEMGPLPIAMREGLIYCADEYDFAIPSVLAVYQPVLEGKALVIKEADEANRVIKPHPDFRFVATGNTNGQGDETGLYQGTNIGNAANFERFGIVRQAVYLDEKLETEIITKQADVPVADAKLIVKFANKIRDAYDGGQLGMTISPRALINAAKLGARRGDYRVGLTLAFINRLTSSDRIAASEMSQRIFG